MHPFHIENVSFSMQLKPFVAVQLQFHYHFYFFIFLMCERNHLLASAPDEFVQSRFYSHEPKHTFDQSAMFELGNHVLTARHQDVCVLLVPFLQVPFPFPTESEQPRCSCT